MSLLRPFHAAASALSIALIVLNALGVSAHGDHGAPRQQIPVVAADSNWAAQHMAGTMHLSISFTSASVN